MKELTNLANFWSNLVTRTSHDPGFTRSIFISALITVREGDPSESSATT